MIGLEDRQALARDIDAAHEAGARLRLACEIAGIDVRTLQRWKAQRRARSGRWPAAGGAPDARHALSAAERAELLRVANEPRFADVPPARIVPMLADEGVYLASESTFSRVLRAHGQNAHRGRAKAPQASRPPTTHIATAPRQVWCWDMTYLPADVVGRWFHLYLILDLYSRKIVGWEVHDTRRRRPCRAPGASHGAGRGHRRHAQQARAARRQRRHAQGHDRAGDAASGWASSPRTRGLASATTTPMPRRCSAPPSTGPSSPPRASPTSTTPAPGRPASCAGTTIDHRHSGIRYVSPAQRHAGDDHAILAARHALYTQARERNPARWSRTTRNWSPIGAVTLNPERDSIVKTHSECIDTQPLAA